MAHLTIQQADMIRELRGRFGEDSQVRIEATKEAYGLVRVKCPMEMEMDLLGLGPHRTIYLRPDGSRLTWAEPQFTP